MPSRLSPSFTSIPTTPQAHSIELPSFHLNAHTSLNKPFVLTYISKITGGGVSPLNSMELPNEN